VFELGSTYLKLRSALHLKDPIPEVDPAIYNIRFAHRLDFGTQKARQVAADATRLVRRFKADWMTQGRRPAGIAGACLVVAARMSGFLRTPEEVAQVVKVSPTTIKRRLMEFARTHVATRTVAEWRTLTDKELEVGEEAEPPIVRENRMKEQEQVEAVRIERLRDQGAELDEDDEDSGRSGKKKQKKGRKGAALDSDGGRGSGEVSAVHNADGAIQAVAGELVDEDVDEDEEEEDDNLAEMEQGDFIGELNQARDDPEAVAREVAAASKAFKRQARALKNDDLQEDDLAEFDGLSDVEDDDEGEEVGEEEDVDHFDQWDDKEATYRWLGTKYFQDEIDTFKLKDDELFKRVDGWVSGRDPIDIYNEIRCVDRARKERERYAKEERQSEFPDIDDEELEGYYVMAEEDIHARTRAWLSHNGRWLEEEQGE
jgi:transcription factor IIIB subunit 2